MFGLELPPGAATPTGSAVSLLQHTIEEANRPPVLELGPMTNLGQHLGRRPRLVEKIRSIVAMGGAVRMPGNASGNREAETNIWLDPAAVGS